jgi:hypothetical protein
MSGYNWENHNNYTDDEEYSGGIGRVSGLPPSFRSAIILWLVVLAIAMLNAFTAGSSIIFTYPGQLLLYVLNGGLAAYFALNEGGQVDDLPRIGALAGFWLWILPALFYIVGSLLLGLFTFGLGWLGIFGFVLCGPIDLAIEAILGMTGAWLYGKYTGGSSSSEDIY